MAQAGDYLRQPPATATGPFSPPRPRHEPHWLLRVEDEQMQTLLRASANYASKGFDEGRLSDPRAALQEDSFWNL
jgi:hypothetical protein